MDKTYDEIIESKIAVATQDGIKINRSEISDILKPHQKDIVYWSILGGRRAIFAAFGLGKTIIQLEICRILKNHVGGKALVICPLGVKQEFSEDAKNLLNLTTEYVKTDSDVENSTADIMLTNYERVRDGGITPDNLSVICLDEAAVLRGYGTKTYQEFLKLFPNVRFRFVCTATPSPNRYKELIHYGGFLGVMDTGEALTRFFKRDPQKAGNLLLHEARADEFWAWLASWACFVSLPSDLGHDDAGYDLPELRIHTHCVEMSHADAGEDRNGQSMLFRDAAMGLREAAREKRESLPQRIDKMMEIISDQPDKHFILWHDLESERHAIKKALPVASEVYGSLDLETREKRIIDFAWGRTQYIATKPRISGAGCNFQRFCSSAVFVGIGYKFADFIQAIHRINRFLQKDVVDIHIIYASTEQDILRVLMKKWEQHKKLVAKMTEMITEHGLSDGALAKGLKRKKGVVRISEKGKRFEAINNDCVIETKNMKDNSVDLICTSIPFGNHYEYSANYNDFGHNTGNDMFFKQLDHLTPELLRVLAPGRIYACHVKDRIMFGAVTGYGMPSVDPFHMLTTMHTIRHGFIFIGMITIETDVVRENNQTYRLGWTEQCKDGSKMGVGCPEYILLFRKLPTDTSKAYSDTKVMKQKADYTRGQWQIDARAKWNSSGNRFMMPEEIEQMNVQTVTSLYSSMVGENVYDYKEHVGIANTMDAVDKLPATFETLKVPARNDEVVWSDVNRMRTLNANQARRNLTQHICPLQFDIVERLINRYTNKSEVVYDPFGGIMTVPYMAVKMDRYGIGCELNKSYWKDGLHYLKNAEIEIDSPTLFDVAETEGK